MTSTYKIPMQLQNDFKNTCRLHGLPPAKVLRRMIALYTKKPDKLSLINSIDFLQEIATEYGYEAL